MTKGRCNKAERITKIIDKDLKTQLSPQSAASPINANNPTEILIARFPEVAIKLPGRILPTGVSRMNLLYKDL